MTHPDRNEDSQFPVGFEGHARQQRLRMAQLPLAVKIAWLEEAQRVVESLERSRRESQSRAAAPPAR